MHCSERDKLTQKAALCVREISEITAQQAAALKANEMDKLLALDSELELKFGEKERAFGALQQHTKEHGCGK